MSVSGWVKRRDVRSVDPDGTRRDVGPVESRRGLCGSGQLTTMMRLRNVLRLVTALDLERHDVCSVDPDGSREVFKGCPC